MPGYGEIRGRYTGVLGNGVKCVLGGLWACALRQNGAPTRGNSADGPCVRTPCGPQVSAYARRGVPIGDPRVRTGLRWWGMRAEGGGSTGRSRASASERWRRPRRRRRHVEAAHRPLNLV